MLYRLSMVEIRKLVASTFLTNILLIFAASKSKEEKNIWKYTIGNYQIKEHFRLNEWKNSKIIIDKIDYQPLYINETQSHFDSILILYTDIFSKKIFLRPKLFTFIQSVTHRKQVIYVNIHVIYMCSEMCI